MHGSTEPLSWAPRDGGLQIKAPSHKPCDHAYTFKITLK